MTRSCLVSLASAGLAAAAWLSAQQRLPQQPSGIWVRGDTHVHDDHSSDGSQPRQRSHDKAPGNVSIADQIDQATKIGLDFLPLTDHRTYDQHYDPLWESSSLLLIPAEEANGSPHATVLGAADSIVQGAARKDRAVFTHVQQSLWDAHSQDAVWTVAHADDGELNPDGTMNPYASVQGIDLVEVWNRAKSVEKQIDYAENRWNAGFRFGAAGASDSHFRERWDVASPGMPTTSVFTFAYNERGIIEALRLGHTSMSSHPNGPFVTLTTDLKGGGYSAMGGDEVFVPAATSGHLRISTRRCAGLQVLIYRSPGRSAGAFKTLVPRRDDEVFLIDITSGQRPEWYRVEVRDSMELRAFASPIFVSPAPAAPTPELPIPRDQGIDDRAVLVAGAPQAFAGFADVATDAGDIHTVTEEHPADASSTIVYRRRDANGVWTDGGRVLSGRGLARFPHIAAKGTEVWIVWQEDAVQVPHRPEIHARHSSDRGVTWQPVQIIRAVEGRAEHPAVAITSGGTPFFAWQEIRSGEPMDVMVQEVGADPQPKNLSRAGKTIEPGANTDSRSPRYPASVLPSVAVGSDGRIAVVWQDNRTDPDPGWTGTAANGEGTNPDNWQILVAIRDARGLWKAVAELGAAEYADRHPDVAFGRTGELVVAWESKALRSSGANLSVHAAVSTDGAVFGPPVVVAADPLTMSERPRLGVDPDGSVRAVWYDSRSEDWRWRVMTAVYKRDSGWTAGVLLNGRGINTWPATSGGVIIFASTRNATRLQRDPTQQVFLLARP